jgi:cathepsin F
MQAWVVNHGPLSVALNAEWLQLYEGGVLTSGLLGCDGHSLDHAVLVTGYGNGGLITSVDFWNVKNSWGADWGEKGYFRLQRGVGLCGINNAVSTAFM